MKHWGSEDDVASQTVRPARDAERSEHTFDDKYRRGDTQGRLKAYGRTTDHHTAITEEQRAVYQLSLAPIGIFDSGAGGLTILQSLCEQLPSENYIYLGDTAHVPYGKRSDEEITDLTIQACHFLIGQGAKMIVIACNTASQVALATLRANFSLPIVGVVPAVKPAARMTKNGRIGIAATNHAVKAAYLRQLIDDFAAGIEVEAVGCPDLVTLVEQGKLEGYEVESILRRDLQPLITAGIDVLVLGCTHFPALRSAIEQVMGKHVQIIDSGAAIARRTRTVLEAENMLHPVDTQHAQQGELHIWCTGDASAFSRVASRILNHPVTAHIAVPSNGL